MPIAFQRATLSNGLEIIGEVDSAAHTAAMGFFVKTGARDEAPADMGVSHFLEHMMFKGTESRSAEEVDREFDDLGAQHNAYTSSELTAFWCHLLPEHLARGEAILADILRPALRQDDFDDEKKVILEEIAMYRDNPFWVLYEDAMEAYYGRHPLGHRVLGTAETVSGLSRDRMLAYFSDRYSADNTVVAMAGRLDFDGMVRQIESHCGGWATTRTQRRHDAADRTDGELALTRDTVNRHYLLMLAPAPGINDDRRHAAAMLAQVLGDVEGSRLFWALVETGVADEAQAQFDAHDGVGDYLVYCSCPPEDADRAEQIVLEQIDQLVGSLTEDDLQRSRSKLATSATLQGELPAGRMRRLGRTWTYAGEYRSLEDELERINAVTLDEMRAVHDTFPLHPHLTARLSPAAG